jgi:hypothetical protein
MFLAETSEKNEPLTVSFLCCLFTEHFNVTLTYQTFILKMPTTTKLLVILRGFWRFSLM